MFETKDITKFSIEQMQKFLMSFDIVMCDIDGVLWQFNKPIEGASESLMTLQNLGKQLYLVTNNTTITLETYCKCAQHTCLNLNSDHIINPTKLIIWYLKKIDFRDEVLAIVSDQIRKIYIEAGIRLTEQPKVFETDPAATIQQILDRPSVKAVIVDFDVNCNWAKLTLAITCLKRNDVLYLTGMTEEWLNVSKSPEIKLLGPKSFVDLINKQSGRKPISCGKPSQHLKDYVLDKFNVTDLRRCLFIGDSVSQDMKFASMCGFIKLFVGSGCDTLEKAQKTADTYPDYYLPKLSQLFSTYKDLQCQCIANHKDN